MTTASINYTAPETVTITLTSLGIDGYRESAGVNNTSNLYLDALLGGSVQVGAVGADGTLDIYVYGSNDAGTTYSGGLAGTNETITWGTTPSTSSVNGFNNIVLIGSVDVDTTDDNNDIEFGPFSVASAFGGVLPEKWGVVVKNSTDIALHATGTNNAIKFTPIKYTSA